MNEQDKQLLKSILNTLTHVSYTSLTELQKIKREDEKYIELNIKNKEALEEMIEKLFEK
jgi:hypothetical protein